MHSDSFRDTATGAILGVIVFMMLLSAVPEPVLAQSQSGPIFSITMLAPTTNPARRQWAAIIASSYQTVGIDAKVVYVSFSALDDAIWPTSGPAGNLYAQGGYDAVFIGWVSAPIPDISSTTNYRDIGPNDVPPIGNNYAFFNNATVNNLIDQYSHTLDVSARNAIGQQIVEMVAQQRPYLVILSQAEVWAMKSYMYPWNQQTNYATTQAPDFQHFKIVDPATNGNSINVALSSDVNCINVLPTSSCNTVYDIMTVQNVYSLTQEIDVRNFQYINSLAKTITPSADGLTYTITLNPATFQDSVPVTANDAVFSYLAQLDAQAQSVALGFYQTYFGLNSQFTFTNGTSRYIENGTLYMTKPAGFVANSMFTATSASTYSFTMPQEYAFANPGLTAIVILPMHLWEQYAPSAWSTAWFTTLGNSPHTYTWNKAVYGGNGSYTALGPVGAGPYLWKGYNSVTATTTLQKYNGYWNATGLQALGEFDAQFVHITTISGAKDAALAAFATGQANILDSNYGWLPSDYSTIQSDGGVVTVTAPPGGLFQELGLNLHSPIWGTGTATPLGQSNPAMAQHAALLVRQALSELIPRQYIIDTLDPTAKLGITEVASAFTFLYPSSVKPDPYDPAGAVALLQQAGYTVSAYTSGTTFTFTTTPINIGNIHVQVPGFILGNSLTLSGQFAINPTESSTWQGLGLTLEQSTDNGTTWTPVMMTVTNTGGYYSMTYTPTVTGSAWYRVFNTGVAGSYIATGDINDPATLEGLVSPTVDIPANVTDTSFGPVTKLDIGTMADVVSALVQAQTGQLSSLATQVNTAISSLGNQTAASLNTLSKNSATQADVTNLSNQISTLTYAAYGALAVAIILGLVAIVLSRRKGPS